MLENRISATLFRSIHETLVAPRSCSLAYLFAYCLVERVSAMAASSFFEDHFEELIRLVSLDRRLCEFLVYHGYLRILSSDTKPIVCSHVCLAFHIVAFYIIPAGTVVRYIKESARVVSAWARLIIVLAEIDLSVTTAAVSCLESPVIDHIVAIIYILGAFHRRETRIAARMVGKEIMMEAGVQSTPYSSESVGSLGVL